MARLLEGAATSDRVLEGKPVLAEIYRDGVVALPSGDSRAVESTGVGRHEGQRIYEMVLRERPQRTLEVGMALGLSSLWICQALSELGTGHHIAIDPHQAGEFGNAGLANVARAGCAERLTFYEEPSHRVLPRLEAQGLKVDLIFIDGMHLFDYAFVDLFFADRLLRPGGMLIFHDVGLPGVAKVVRFAVGNLGYVEESQPPGTPRARRVLRRARRLGRGSATLPKAALFALGGEKRETQGAELPWPREDSTAFLRKTDPPRRDWREFEPF